MARLVVARFKWLTDYEFLLQQTQHEAVRWRRHGPSECAPLDQPPPITHVTETVTRESTETTSFHVNFRAFLTAPRRYILSFSAMSTHFQPANYHVRFTAHPPVCEPLFALYKLPRPRATELIICLQYSTTASYLYLHHQCYRAVPQKSDSEFSVSGLDVIN